MPWKRRSRIVILFAGALLLLPAGAQDLAAAAEREKERRKGIDKTAPRISESDLALSRPVESVTAAATVAAAASFNWYPGYYVLSASTNPTRKQRMVDDPLVAPFH